MPPSSPRPAALALAAALATALGATPGPGARAQTAPPPTPLPPAALDSGPARSPADSGPPPAASCFRPRPLDRCRAFWVVEAGYHRHLAGTTAPREGGPRPQLTTHWSLELGRMANVSPRTALGGAAFAGFNGVGGRWGAKARYRRWSGGGRFAADLGAGAVSAVARTPRTGPSLGLASARGLGVTADAGVSWRGAAGVTARGDAVRVRGRTAHAAYGGVHLGGRAAVGGVAVYVAAIAVAVALLASGG